MRHWSMAWALALLATGAAWAGRYDEPGFLRNHLLSGGPPKDGIPALTNPTFVDPEQVNYLNESDLVIGVVVNGEAKAYPENLGWWHEIINDRIGGRFISATLCPLTGTAQVFEATGADNRQIEFGVSGLLINSNLVMYDRRDGSTLWPQMIYTAINGERLGERLELLPALETTWAMWKKLYPNSQVPKAGTGWDAYLGNRPVYTENAYTIYPYVSRALGDYRVSHKYLLFLPSTNGGQLDGRHQVKDVVLGICRGEQTKAYPFKDLPEGVVINDFVGDDLMAIVFDAESKTAIPYFSQVGDRILSFYAVEPEGELPVEFMDVETRSRWNMLGQAVDGPLQGEQLRQVPAYNAMWFAWAAYWPDTEVWSGEGIIDEVPPITAVLDEQAALPERFALRQNRPNPFNPETLIQYELPFGGLVRLSIYNAAGQKVRTLVDEDQTGGLYLQHWDGRDDTGAQVASGTYLYRLEMPDARLGETRTMTLVR